VIHCGTLTTLCNHGLENTGLTTVIHSGTLTTLWSDNSDQQWNTHYTVVWQQWSTVEHSLYFVTMGKKTLFYERQWCFFKGIMFFLVFFSSNVRTPFMVTFTRHNKSTLCDKVCQRLTTGRLYTCTCFLHQKSWLPRYNWNIVENGCTVECLANISNIYTVD
jgi:hypothetical protein